MKRSMKTLVGEVCACLAMSMLLVPFAGCGDGKTGGGEKLPEKELQELRKEIAQMKNELREMRRSIDRRPMGDSSMHIYPVKHAERFGNGMTNGVSRIRYAKPRPTPEEMEERRKMMQNPEMRKKFEAERKARMEERRRQHEERRREMEARRNARTVPNAVAPVVTPADTQK